jgi:hypothetical protein
VCKLPLRNRRPGVRSREPKPGNRMPERTNSCLMSTGCSETAQLDSLLIPLNIFGRQPNRRSSVQSNQAGLKRLTIRPTCTPTAARHIPRNPALKGSPKTALSHRSLLVVPPSSQQHAGQWQLHLLSGKRSVMLSHCPFSFSSPSPPAANIHTSALTAMMAVALIFGKKSFWLDHLYPP